MKQVVYFLQYIGFIFIYFLYKILPLNLSLKVSSFLFRTFGKFSRANKTAINNCKYVFPNLKDEEIQKILNFCNLDPDENCFNHHKNSKTPIKTVSISQARQAVYSSSVRSSDKYQDHLKEMFENLIYED